MRIYLTEGFDGGPVRLSVNGHTVLDLPEARTNYSSGVAATAIVDSRGQLKIVVELPDRGVKADHVTTGRDGVALLVRLGAGGPEFEEATEPVRFL